MEPSAHALLTEWESFYVIVGSSAGALTGLMFVVIALAGGVYVFVVLRRMIRQADTGYKAVLEDWVWHLLLPMGSYAGLFVGAAGLAHEQRWAMRSEERRGGKECRSRGAPAY